MSIMFADDFKGYGTDTARMLDGLYGELQRSSLTEDPDPNADGLVYSTIVDPVNGTRMRRVFPSNYTTAGFCFRMWMDSLPADAGRTLAIGTLPASSDYGANPSLMVDSTGRIRVMKGNVSGNTPLGVTTNPVLTANAWHHIEIKCVAGLGMTGSVEVRVDGVTVLVLMEIDAGAQYSQFYINSPNSIGSVSSWYFKDLVTWNGTGASNTSFLGTVTVVGMEPDSDVDPLNWTPSTGTTGWDLINNAPPNDAQDYITAPHPSPPPATFGLTDLPVNVSSVRALITQVRARKLDGGDGNLQSSLVSNAVEGDGLDRPITTAFTYYEDVFETDPNTGAAWTPGAADAAQLRVNRTL